MSHALNAEQERRRNRAIGTAIENNHRLHWQDQFHAHCKDCSATVDISDRPGNCFLIVGLDRPCSEVANYFSG